MGKLTALVVGVLVVAAVVATQVFFIVQETNQAVVLQLGEYLYTASNPGLYVKTPFAQQVVYFDRRLLSTDAPPQEYLTLDKKRLRVDHVTRWRIEDPFQFLVSVSTEAGARARLDDVVFSEMRRALATFNFNVIIADERDPIMDAVSAATQARAKAFGIHVVDVRIKRADLPKEVEQSVFARMKAERSREANRYRAEGEEQGAQIRASADRERVVIVADAQEKAARTRGEGDAESIRIYADALNLDPEFFAFRRRLEAYEKVLRERDTIVVPPDSGFFNYLSGHKTSTGR
ncbi:MAG: protease modulator HflC [Chloroflexi bacterium]|nr:protease modulator HflC [Chloroflexota bacterium]